MGKFICFLAIEREVMPMTTILPNGKEIVIDDSERTICEVWT